jgi:hypothetical protein
MQQGSLRAKVEGILVGSTLQGVTRHEYSWTFAFETADVSAQCLWRMVSGGRVVLTSSDDGQQFGLPEPLDAEVGAKAVLLHRCVSALTVDAETADLRITFENGARLEFLSTSAGYEAWQLNKPGSCIVAGNQGQLSEAQYVKPNVMVGGPWE